MTVEVYLTGAPAFIAGLVKQGLTFDAKQVEDKIVIKLTGGY